MENVSLSFDRADGGYWLLEGRARDGVWVRLRIEHLSMLDPDDVQAEVETQTAGENRPTYKPVGEEFLFAMGTPAWETDRDWTLDFLEYRRADFVALGHIWCELSFLLDVGPATGQLKDASTD